MGEPSIDSLHDPYEEQLGAARYKAERDAVVQELQAMRERNIELWMESGMANELVTCAEQKAERLGKLVWRLQNRLARSHRREKQLRKGMREWRDKVMGAPVRTVSAYDLLPEEDLQALRWVRDNGGLDVVKTHSELLQQLKGERDELREMCRDYKKHGAYGTMLEYRRVLNGVCKRLGLTDGTGKPEQDGVIYEAIERRLMPEGCEWPRFKDGTRLAFEDELPDFACTIYKTVKTVRFQADGTAVLTNGGGSANVSVIVRPGERVKRLAVPAGDGKPLEEGQTVWRVDTGVEYWVKRGQTITSDAVVIIRKTNCDCESEIVKASQLTHTKPEIDSWERIEEDIGKNFSDYWGCKSSSCANCSATVDGKTPCLRFGVDNCIMARNVDIIRRCKALAERDAS